VLPNDARREGPSRSRRARRRTDLGAPERLEGRELLAFSPLGMSTPDLTISSATAGPVATYGGNLGLQIDVSNLGASSIIEPLSIAPGAPSFADAPASTVGVFLSRSPRFGPGAFPIAAVPIPAIRQNSIVRVDTTISLPFQPPGFPGSGGTVYLFLRANIDNQVEDLNPANNTTGGIPVTIEAPLPDLQAIALDVPPVMQPGDTIAPEIKVANFGTVDTGLQGPVTVDLVASTDTNFGPGDQVLETFTIDNIPPLSIVPFSGSLLGDVNINDPANVRTVAGAPVTLPAGPPTYFLGVIVDPNRTIRQIHEIGEPPTSALSPVRPVGPPIAGLIPAGQLQAAAPSQNVFPTPAFGPLQTFASLRNQFLTTGSLPTTTTTTAADQGPIPIVVQSQSLPLPPRFSRARPAAALPQQPHPLRLTRVQPQANKRNSY
jgi:hypothetical protein